MAKMRQKERTIIGKRSAQRENMDKTKKRTNQLIDPDFPGLQQKKVHKRGQWFGREDPDSTMILGLMGVLLGRLAGCHDKVASKPSYDIDRLN